MIDADDRRQVRLLLNVDARRRSLRGSRRVLFAAMLGFLNLFLLAYCERFFDTGLHLPALGLVLLLQSAGLIVLALLTFTTTVGETLAGAKVLPIRALPRAIYAVTALVRDPLSLALLLGSAFGIPVMVHAPPTGAPITALTVLLLAFGLQSLTGVITLVARARSETAAGVALLSIAGLLAAVLWSLAVGPGSIVALIPPVHWAAAAIASAAGERWGEAVSSLLLLSAIPPVAVAAGALLTEQR